MRRSPTISPRTCELCGITYSPTGTNQRFCTTCMIEQDRSRKRKYEARKYPNRKPKQKTDEVCCICGNVFSSHYDGKPYCNKHYLRMYNNGTPNIVGRKSTNTFTINDDIVICSTKNGRTFIIDLADLESVKKHSWCFSATGYPVANISGKTTKLHRFLLNAEPGLLVDHINGDVTDNRRCNLRLCTCRENARNTSPSKSNPTGIVGVKIIPSGKYVAQICVNRKTITIGRYDSLDEAAFARKVAEQYYFGEFAPSTSRTVTTVPGGDA